VDYGLIFRVGNLLPMLAVVLVMTLIALCNVTPWRLLVQAISNVTLSYRTALPVFVKANLMKYIPGNIFQYVGRNQLAIDQKLPHLEVAFATMLDVGLTVLSAGLISVIFLSSFVGELFRVHLLEYTVFIFLVLAVLLVLALLLFIFRKKIKVLFRQYRHFFTGKTVAKIIISLAYYLVVLLLSGLMFLVVLTFILGEQLPFVQGFQLITAYTLAWLVGFVTPGAPAGIGIKELVMVSVTGNLLSYQTIALAMVIMRILMIIADILAFIMGRFVIAKERM